ncbi:TPA: hypothetical protein DDW69_04105 [candidate division CPR2 bacterium]|uniref:Uncharacterized protein n=1 Tax=candidate division CPR2 bacterium GW2011_GWC1_41_48 TaxID=1618344 RepID=A0A0G0YI74_UNCC2|nr:MAG: hypothetical protein UT47_C0002G0290 [candidate division CPR2 bacterium GW2011_GWC2_39_35]KKR28438.1 MAG: hypothetical protein UT60_C0020G0008 [candidate division CPR2 bacterium GW2011_GWD2_39_7]KKR29054.1 MAG: hypothetical protein UT59_C0013G0009 [candidate division CPR2 bacterium GW2011_GWD1_39_7]KKS09236.1 MAG: hypothetical protein UU65_C0002G0014 [candidate division CPR2 bacterium GW2011_GWC1_41_48]OGB61822.1 MAG: hypothetical protein A2Y27_03005 [candidate division CPR2 bacterium G
MAKKKTADKKYHLDHLKKKISDKEVLVASKKDDQKTVKKVVAETVYFYRDLKKVGLIGMGFFAFILALYYAVNYTHVLNPVLKLFKLA